MLVGARDDVGLGLRGELRVVDDAADLGELALHETGDRLVPGGVSSVGSSW